jgi:hypothetical protein
MYWVTPGRYYVNASPSRGPDFGAPTSNEVIDQGYATTYYPGTMDASLAATIEVHQKPVRGIQAVLIPDRRERRDHYKTSTSDQNGHFTFRGLTPGDYRLFAWEHLEPFAYNDPEVLRRYEHQGSPIKISESTKLTVEAKMIPAGQ